MLIANNATLWGEPILSKTLSALQNVGCDSVPPTIVVVGPTRLCANDSTILVCSPAKSYNWSNGASTQQITVKKAGIYSVTATYDKGCSLTSEKIAIASTPLEVIITQYTFPLSLCLGDTVYLAAQHELYYPYSHSYQWDNEDKDTTRSIKVAKSGDYSVAVSDNNGCFSRGFTHVVVNPTPVTPKPIITANGNTLSTDSAIFYQWMLDGEEIVDARNRTYTATQNGKYAVKIDGSCNPSDEYLITGILKDGIDWEWAKGTGAKRSTPTWTTTDLLGNIIVAGYFYDSIIFGSDTLTSINANNLFIAKYDPSGKILWAKKADSTSTVAIRSITTDSDENIIISGSLSYTNKRQVFVAKYSGAGQALWSRNFIVDNGPQATSSVTTDLSNNIYLTAGFVDYLDTIVFTPDFNKEFINLLFTKLDPSGNQIWFKEYDKNAASKGGRAGQIVVGSKSGEGVFLIGEFFSPTYTIDSIVLKGPGNFIAKYNGAGEVIWARMIPKTLFAAMGEDKIYIVGGLSNFPWDTKDVKIAGNADFFIAQMDQNGNILWVRGDGGTGRQDIRSIAVDPLNNIWVSGVFNGSSLTLGQHTLVVNKLPYDYSNFPFIAKYDSSGTPLLAEKINIQNGIVYVTTDVKAKVIVSGIFSTPRFTIGNQQLNNTSRGSIFIAKNSDCVPVYQSIYAGEKCLGDTYTLANGNTIIVSAAGVCYDSLKTVNGCDSIVAIHFKIISKEVIITADGPVAFCKGGKVTLDAGPGFKSYLWSNGQTTPTIEVTTTQSNTVTVMDSTGCSSTSTPFLVNVDTLPLLNLHALPPVCYPETIDLSSPSVTAGSTTGKLSYWRDPELINPLNWMFYKAINKNDIYYIRLAVNGCAVIKPVTVEIMNCVTPADPVIVDEINVGIHPNPFSLETTVILTEELQNASVVIIDLFGKEVQHFTISGREFKIYGQDLHPGLYFIRVYDKDTCIEKGKMMIY